MVGAGEVEVARGVGEHRADAVAGVGVADQARRRAGGVVALFDAGAQAGRFDVRVRAVGDAGDLAEQAGRQVAE